jgi:hypothetical protein
VNGYGWLALLAVAVAGGWAVSLRLHPYAQCFACRGQRGKNVGSGGKVWGRCPVCKGNGERLRAGARLVRPGLRKK